MFQLFIYTFIHPSIQKFILNLLMYIIIIKVYLFLYLFSIQYLKLKRLFLSLEKGLHIELGDQHSSQLRSSYRKQTSVSRYQGSRCSSTILGGRTNQYRDSSSLDFVVYH